MLYKRFLTGGIWSPRPKRQNPYRIANARIGVFWGSGRALGSKNVCIKSAFFQGVYGVCGQNVRIPIEWLMLVQVYLEGAGRALGSKTLCI